MKSSSGSADQVGLPKHLEGLDLDKVDWRSKDDSYWRSVLSERQHQICRQAGTERPWSGQYCSSHEPGTYYCYCCGQKLFESGHKFESGTGWPSFSEPVTSSAVIERSDASHGMHRVEVLCSRCNAHLGHVFEDGPPPTGKRYCINSACLYRLS